MEKQQQQTGASPNHSHIPRMWIHDDSSVEESRNLIRFLTLKNDQLYRECRSDQNKVRLIRVIGIALVRLNQLTSQQETRHRLSGIPEILVDSRGITYESVRACDLELVSDK
jgi:hypothetical protein